MAASDSESGAITGETTQCRPVVARPQRLGDVTDVAALCKCSAKTIRRLVDLRRIPGVIRIGRLLRFDLDLIGRWLDQGAPMLTRFNTK